MNTGEASDPMPHDPTPQDPAPAHDPAPQHEETQEEWEARRAERMRELLANGEVVDERDAAEAFQEEEDIRFYRGIEDRDVVIAAAREAFEDPATDDIDRSSLCFKRAMLEVALTPDERELLWYHALQEMRMTGLPDDAFKSRRYDSEMSRLDGKIVRIDPAIGAERTRELYDQYQRRFLELRDEREEINRRLSS